jgi:alpha-tubulin suppressor-like RCC1 family protein
MKLLLTFLSILLFGQLASASSRPKIKQLSLGEYQSCALTDSGVRCWGRDSLGAKVPDGLKNPTQIAAGSDHTCALTDDGTICWGGLFDKTPKKYRNPILIFSGSGSNHVCEFYNGGWNEFECWRYDNFRFSRTNLPKATQLTRGNDHECALSNLGVSCWGSLYITSEKYDGSVRADAPMQLKNVTQIASGWNHICALADGEVVCWGDNWMGQSQVPKGLKYPSQITAGQYHSCALTDDGIKCWGSNFFGQSKVPTGLKNPTLITAGADHTCSLTDDGIKCWGKNDDGQATPPSDLSW